MSAEVLLRGLLLADEVQQVVLQLERQAGVHAKGAQGLDLLLGTPADEGAAGKGDRHRVVGGLVARHLEIVVDRDVPAAVARPADVERLALDGAGGHGHELVQHAHLHGVVEARVGQDAAGHLGERQVAVVDGQADALGQVQAGLAAAQLPLVGDVVVDKGRGVEVLHGRRAARRQRGVPAHGRAAERAHGGTVALAAVGGVAGEGFVEVAPHVGVAAAPHVVGGDEVVDALVVFVEI